MPTRQQTPDEILAAWVERDLSAAAAAGELQPAFEVEEQLGQLRDILASGRIPVLMGEPGVGKTAIVHELVRRVESGEGFAELKGRRVVQISLRRRAAALAKRELVGPEMQALVDILATHGSSIVPFFRDLHMATKLDVEAHLSALSFKHPGPILCEGERAGLDLMFEYNPELRQSYVPLLVDEPSLERAGRMLDGWAREQARRSGVHFDEAAVEEALHLAHRFLGRQALPRRAIDLLAQSAGLARGGEVQPAHVIERFSLGHRVPRFLVDPAVPLDLEALRERLGSELLGQQEATEAVVRMIALIKAGLSDVRRPFGVFLFVGPTGVGKTHLAQLLAEILFGSRERLVRFNMADHKNEQDALILFGNPYGDGLSAMRGLLTQRLAAHPFAVLLLDEFEKAHAGIHDRFLQLVDEGSFINGAGETLACRSTIIIATSNAGAEVYRGASFGFGVAHGFDAADRELDRRLLQTFRFEFLNRFDAVVHFRPLAREDIRAIARRELEALGQRAGLRRSQLALEVDEAVLDWLAVHGYDINYGARFLRRVMERSVTTTLAEALVGHDTARGSRLLLSVSGGRIVARVQGLDEPAEPRARVALPVGPELETRSLGRPELLATAARLVEAAAGRLARLDGEARARSALVETMTRPGFWDDVDASRETLERFRELEVAVSVGERIAAPIRRLADVGDEAPLEQLARAVQQAARALSDWEAREAEASAPAVWLVVASQDPLAPAGDWLAQVVAMELAWAHRLHLESDVVAYALTDGEPSWVALDMEGAGAGSCLEMEVGIHRLRRQPETDLRVRVELVVKGSSPDGEWPRLQSARGRSGLFGLEPAFKGRIELAGGGRLLELVAAERATLSWLLHDLERADREPQREALATVRTYAEKGRGVRDPRTGVTTARLKDVLRGELDRFLEGWRRGGRA